MPGQSARRRYPRRTSAIARSCPQSCWKIESTVDGEGSPLFGLFKNSAFGCIEKNVNRLPNCRRSLSRRRKEPRIKYVCRPRSAPCRSPRRLHVAQMRPRRQLHGSIARHLRRLHVFRDRSTHSSGVGKPSSPTSGGGSAGHPLHLPLFISFRS